MKIENILSLFSLLFITLFSVVHSSEESTSTGAPSEIFTKRHSGVAFNPDLPVSMDDMLILAEAVRWSPSSHNDQPWNFIFCDKWLTPESYQKVFDCIKETQKGWIQNVPLLVITVARTKELYKGKYNQWAEYDTGAAALALSLQAVDLGLVSHIIGGFDKDRLTKIFNIPADYKALTITAIGYELEDDSANAKLRIRRPIEENFFLGEWGNGIRH